MPVEIKELIVRATITEGPGVSKSLPVKEESHINENEIISACVEQVLKVFERRKER